LLTLPPVTVVSGVTVAPASVAVAQSAKQRTPLPGLSGLSSLPSLSGLMSLSALSDKEREHKYARLILKSESTYWAWTFSEAGLAKTPGQKVHDQEIRGSQLLRTVDMRDEGNTHQSRQQGQQRKR